MQKIRAPARPMGSSPESRRSVRKREAMEGSAVSRRQAKDAPGNYTAEITWHRHIT